MYDNSQRVLNVLQPDGTTVANEYFPNGLLKKTSGSRTYPVEYTYDAQGRMKTMKTWQTFATDSGAAITTWNYDAYRGWLLSKDYPDATTGAAGTTGPDYTYTAAGRLLTRQWARTVSGNRLTTTYAYNLAGEMSGITYNDSVTPATTYGIDRRGRQTKVTRNSIVTTLTYNTASQLTGESYSGGTLAGLSVVPGYDAFLRRSTLQLFNSSTLLTSATYGYDNASRLQTVTENAVPATPHSATYSYVANSPLVGQVVFKQNTTVRMTTTKTFDNLNRLASIATVGTGSAPSVSAHTYSYNDANQRTRVNLDDGSFWIYEYDKLGQVVSGKRYWSDWTPVAGQQYEYAFDDIGNRTSTKAGGDSGGAGLRSANYTANALNQYSSRDVPAYLNVLGIANANASVTVNSQSPYRKGEYFWKELAPNNASAAVWQAVTNIASLTGTNQTNTGNLFLPKTAEAYTHDLDGNLTSDGRWTNKWDAENRLIDMTSHSSGPSDSRKSLQFAYDSQGRRYSKVVSNWTGSAWTRVLHEKFLYDGWNLLGAFDGTNAAIIRSFLWGLDLSGSMQGAGGVGGLIAFRQHSGSLAGSHFAAYDGNGNVMALVDGTTGNTSARYEYDPFGQTIRASGTMAVVNPVRFSSKAVDDETDYAYYGYRYLNPNVGRWLGRDPIGEHRDIALYSFIGNRGNGGFDAFGLIFIESIENISIEEIRQYGAGYYGYTVAIHNPSIGGADEIEGAYGLPADKSCCVKVRSAKSMLVTVSSLRPNDPTPNQYFTPEGRNAIIGHEDRRVSIYRKGFNEYLAPSELTGYHVTRCGVVCGNDAAEKLMNYIGRLRAAAVQQYTTYWVVNQITLGAVEQGVFQDGLLIGLTGIYNVPQPPPFLGVPCPGESGWQD